MPARRRYYRQCILSRPLTPQSAERQLAWVPEAIAVAGTVLRVRSCRRAKWSEGWTVLEVSKVRFTEAKLPAGMPGEQEIAPNLAPTSRHPARIIPA